MNTKTIEIQMGEKELTFNVTLEAYNNCVNALQMDNKVAPMHVANDFFRTNQRFRPENALATPLATTFCIRCQCSFSIQRALAMVSSERSEPGNQ